MPQPEPQGFQCSKVCTTALVEYFTRHPPAEVMLVPARTRCEAMVNFERVIRLSLLL